MNLPQWWSPLLGHEAVLAASKPLQVSIQVLLLKKVGNARLGESDLHPISPKTPASQYKTKRERAAWSIPCS